MKKADIGMIGLAVMGENLSVNMQSKGLVVAVYDYMAAQVDAFMHNRGQGADFIGAYTIAELVASLKRPRKIMMMVRAGEVVDQVIEEIIPHIEPGDIIIDGGNSNFHDTIRRSRYLEEKGYYFIGTGVSGGEEGALHGPALMPGGSSEAWDQVSPIFDAISAKAGDGAPCCGWIGPEGAGHFIKMVHNGIEYGDMQLICEAYHLMRDMLGMGAGEMQAVFAEWNETGLKSYLIEITANILGYKDADGTPLVEKILDAAGQKGTGKWTGITALNEGVPLTLIGEAVFARYLSAAKDERVAAAKAFPRTPVVFQGDRQDFLDDLQKALYASKIISYAQGFSLMRAAASAYDWALDYGNIAAIWRGGCIIRSVFLEKIRDAYRDNPGLTNLILDPFFKAAIQESMHAWRRIAAAAIQYGIPAPAICSALHYFDGYTCESLPANLLQAQRDYFGAHTYERVDAPRGTFHHTNWTGRGGSTSSTTYNA